MSNRCKEVCKMKSENPKLTAKDIVNKYSLEELCRVFREYGEEKYSYSIAKNIIKAREIKNIETTLELVDIIKKIKIKLFLFQIINYIRNSSLNFIIYTIEIRSIPWILYILI